MLKRSFDIFFSSLGLLLSGPILLIAMVLIWFQDQHSPLYIASRVGKKGKLFCMFKLRSMVINADECGVDSTGETDTRITKVGHIVRRYKLDELCQLWNVFLGDMSMVGPRPNVTRDVALYTDLEKNLLSVRPGITDFSSIIFSDEGNILAGSTDPNLKYNQIIRPWKSRLGLLYVEKNSFIIDLKVIWLTLIAILSREKALNGLQSLLRNLSVDEQLIKVSLRQDPLFPYPPPGSNDIAKNR